MADPLPVFINETGNLVYVSWYKRTTVSKYKTLQ